MSTCSEANYGRDEHGTGQVRLGTRSLGGYELTSSSSEVKGAGAVALRGSDSALELAMTQTAIAEPFVVTGWGGFGLNRAWRRVKRLVSRQPGASYSSS